MHNFKIYLQVAGIAQGGCSSIMLTNLFLYYYEYCYLNNSLRLYRYIDEHNINFNRQCNLLNTCTISFLLPYDFYFDSIGVHPFSAFRNVFVIG